MLKNHLYEHLTSGIDFQLTEGQKDLLNLFADYLVEGHDDRVFILKGYAGTGKTTMINQLVQTFSKFKLSSVLLAPTGRAAKVLASYTGRSAYTIHKKIYRQKSSSDGSGIFVLDKNLHKNALFIVDESSMISNDTAESAVFGTGRLLDDLLEYVYSGSGCRLMLVGDTAQLPPVGLALSPALDAAVIDAYGFGTIEIELTEVVRQEADSGILFNATALRNHIASGDCSQFFNLVTDGFADVERISGGELIDKISWCYDRYGREETLVLTRSNKRANLYNKGIRETILFREAEIARGDLLMMVRNNYFWSETTEELSFIANGDLAEIVHIYGYEEQYGFRFANVSLRFPDYNSIEIDAKILLDTLQIESAALPSERVQKLFYAVAEDYSEIGNKRERWKAIRKDPFYNALQVKFAYAITCHKAQGGQWPAVFIDLGYITPDMINIEFYRWLYTAFTRSTSMLYLVNFDKRFFETV